jgi:hypothetical protein
MERCGKQHAGSIKWATTPGRGSDSAAAARVLRPGCSRRSAGGQGADVPVAQPVVDLVRQRGRLSTPRPAVRSQSICDLLRLSAPTARWFRCNAIHAPAAAVGGLRIFNRSAPCRSEPRAGHPRDVAWCDRDHAFNAFLPDSGVRMRRCDNSFHVVGHVWSCIETLHRPLPPMAPRSIRHCDASSAWSWTQSRCRPAYSVTLHG